MRGSDRTSEFMAMFAALWFGTSNAVREIVDEQTIYRRERQTGLKIPSYIFSKLTLLGFVALVQCISVVVILLAVNRALGYGEIGNLDPILVLLEPHVVADANLRQDDADFGGHVLSHAADAIEQIAAAFRIGQTQ